MIQVQKYFRYIKWKRRCLREYLRNWHNPLERSNPLSIFPQVECHIDVGGGDGSFMHYMERTPICVEVDRIVAAYGHRKTGLNYVVGDALNLPFGDGVASLVSGFELIEHVESPQRLMNEIYRVCSGEAVVSTQNRRVLETINHLKGSYEKWKSLVGHKCDGFYVEELVALSKDAGFKKTKIHMGQRFWLTKLLWKVRLFVCPYIRFFPLYALVFRLCWKVERYVAGGEGLGIFIVLSKYG